MPPYTEKNPAIVRYISYCSKTDQCGSMQEFSVINEVKQWKCAAHTIAICFRDRFDFVI